MIESQPKQPQKPEGNNSKETYFAVPEAINKQKSFSNAPLSKLPNPANREVMGADERTEALRKANEKLANNENLFRAFVQAVEMGDKALVINFTIIENLFVRYCLNLSHEEIRTIVETFQTNCKKWFKDHKTEFFISDRVEKDISAGRAFLTPEGIIEVVEYIRSRENFFNMDPTQEHGFYVSNTHDAHNQTDLFEIISYTNPEGDDAPVIQTMNIVQIKSRLSDETEIESIQRAHEDWVNESLLDFKNLEKYFAIDRKTQIEGVKKVFENMEKIEDTFLEICTNPKTMSGAEMLKELGLDEKLSDKSKAWLVWNYLPTLIAHLDKAREHGKVDENGYYDIKNTLQGALNELTERAKLPRNFTEIREIKSIVASGGRIIEKSIKAKGKLLSYTSIDKNK